MKGKKVVIKIVLIMISILIIGVIAFAIWLPSFIMTGKRQTLEEAFSWQSERYDTSFYKKLDKTEYIIKGFEDYELHVELLKNPVQTDKYIILSHGYTDNRMGSLKYISMYLDFGFNCIIYDLRGHGENEPTFTTYGIREGKDLKCLIEDTRSRYERIDVLGLHGESLGAATTITTLKYKPEVDFVVADCGFSDIENVLRTGYKSAGLPEFLFDIADFMGRLRYHYSLREMRPIESLNENIIPIIFIHGKEDGFIVPKNSEDMAGRTKGEKELYFISKAGHAESILVNPTEYRERVGKFLANKIKGF